MNHIEKPPYAVFPVVCDNKITLRKIIDSDIDNLVEISFYDAVQATSVKRALEMNYKIDEDYHNGESLHWGIVDNQSDNIVGTCGYYRGFKNDERELGCILLPQYRGQGFMTSAMLLAIDFGVNKIGLKRIWAITSPQNDKSIKLLERVGFEKGKVISDNEVKFELVL